MKRSLLLLIYVSCTERGQQQASGACNHCFHDECLLRWTTNDRNDCPTCRQPLWDREGLPRLVLGNGDRVDEFLEAALEESPRSRNLRLRQPPERAGFPWAAACRVMNVICFVVGVGYMVGSLTGKW